MIDVYLSKGYGTISNNVGAYLTGGSVGTEINKGFSTCSLEFNIPERASVANVSLLGTSDIVVCKDGDLIWSGFPARIRRGGNTLSIEGVGYYNLFERYYFNDGSEDYEYVYQHTADVEYVGIVDEATKYGASVRCVSTHPSDVPLLSFSMRLQRIGRIEGNLVFAIHTSPDVENGWWFNAIPANSISEAAGGEDIEINMLAYNGIIANGQTFYVGFFCDSTYTADVDASNYIRVIATNLGSPGNGYVKSNTGWWNTNYDFTVGVISRGMFDINPGLTQDELLSAVIGYYDTTFGVTYPFRVNYQRIADYAREIPNFKTGGDATAYEIMQTIMKYGLDISGNYFPIVMYTYRDSLIRPVYTYFDYIDYSKPSLAYITPLGDNISTEISFEDMVTQVRVMYELEGGLRFGDLDYTRLPYIYPREMRVELNDIFNADEAETVLGYITEQEKHPLAMKNVSVTQHEVLTVSGRAQFPIHRLRAGMYIDVENSEYSYVDTYDRSGKIKYLVRGTSYDLMSNENTLDLSRYTDKEMLLSLITG